MNNHRFNYNWDLKTANFTKNKGTVFSCFSAGGGSTMGYKLAGFDVIGCNEIDSRMMDTYITNHNPKYHYLESIETFKLRNDLPSKLYNLDILDGSPPCSSFSMSGNREKDWGKQKKFKEGQTEQILDDLFFHFIDLANKLQPKIVVAENVTGILMGNATKYVKRIYANFKKAGYYLQQYVLDSATMGVPQKRKRVFFIALRNDLLQYNKKLKLEFNEKEISYSEIRQLSGNISAEHLGKMVSYYWDKCEPGNSFSTVHETGSYFNEIKLHPNKVIPTIRASGLPYDYKVKRKLYKSELISAGSFPTDYDFETVKPNYIIGMSVPPLMIANIAYEINKQWLNSTNTNIKHSIQQQLDLFNF